MANMFCVLVVKFTRMFKLNTLLMSHWPVMVFIEILKAQGYPISCSYLIIQLVGLWLHIIKKHLLNNAIDGT